MAEEIVQQISLSEIYPSRNNRKVGGFNREKLEQLADSIRTVGVQQAAVVRARSNGKGKYELVAGERRWRASKIAGQETLPCVVRDVDDVTLLKIQSIENLQRDDVHPLDEADGYARLITQADYDVEALAKEVGRSASYIYQRLKLRELVKPARKMLVEGEIAAGHAILIARLQPAAQLEIVQWLEEERRYAEAVSVRDLDRYIHDQILLDLAKAPFKRDDADLVKPAGACSACSKRTGFNEALFADVCKKDYCTDPPCFHQKLDALVARRRQELEDQEHLEVATFCREKIPDKVLPYYEWIECKKKDKGAQRALVVAGPDRGRLTWATTRRTMGRGAGLTEKEKAERKRRVQALKAKRVVRARLWEAIQEPLEGAAKKKTLPQDLEMITTLQAWERLWDNHRKLLCEAEGWKKPEKKKGDYSTGWRDLGAIRIRKMCLRELKVFQVKIALSGELEVSEYDNSKPEKLTATASLLGLNPAAIEKAARKALDEKAAQAARKKKAKKRKRAARKAKAGGGKKS